MSRPFNICKTHMTWKGETSTLHLYTFTTHMNNDWKITVQISQLFQLQLYSQWWMIGVQNQRLVWCITTLQLYNKEAQLQQKKKHWKELVITTLQRMNVITVKIYSLHLYIFTTDERCSLIVEHFIQTHLLTT